MKNESRQPGTPFWFTVLVILFSLPVFSLPALLASCPPELKAMVWLYPFYVVFAAYFAWQCYLQRRALAWILVVLILLGHAAVWTMVTQSLAI